MNLLTTPTFEYAMNGLGTAKEVLQRYWGYPEFRAGQERIIEAVLAGKDTLALLPTGGGKSLCYQVPALCQPGTCLVISPLVALMKDQSERLLQLGIPSIALHGELSRDEQENFYDEIAKGRYKFVMLSPERLKSTLLRDYLESWTISLLAVDEAHCISQWGYDFRPSYLEIGEIRSLLPRVPCLALTASATPRVQDDILRLLKFKNAACFSGSFLRENLRFAVQEPENKMVALSEALASCAGTKLVYCRSRKRTVELSQWLQALGFSVDAYHAGFTPEERSRKQELWLKGHIETMVCTNAFGMGIDKPDVRMVVHYDIPDTPEGYYQEAGRAGRDGLMADALLLFQARELQLLYEGIELRFPVLTRIRLIYDLLCRYLEIPYESGLLESKPFDVLEFAQSQQLNAIEVMHVVRILEQHELIVQNDALRRPPKVQMTSDKVFLQALEQQYPELDEMVKTLLRMYGGIWTQPVVINEFQLAQRMQVARDYVPYLLDRLHQLKVIDYHKSHGLPEIQFLHNRVKPEFLLLNQRLMAKLKQAYTERVECMLAYARLDNTQCRNQHILAFFGQNIPEPCGNCDLCRQQVKKIQKFDPVAVKNTILHLLTLEGPLSLSDVTARLTQYKPESVRELLRLMLSESLLRQNEKGQLKV